jgi:hypothetical protein
MAHLSFVQLQDRVLPSSLRLLEWCPTMDLVALVSADGGVMVVRTLTWEKLFVVPGAEIAAPVSSIRFRPDGAWGGGGLAARRRCLNALAHGFSHAFAYLA